METSVRDVLLGRHQVRRSWAQKGAFLAWAQAYGRRLGYETAVEESGRWVRSRNLVFGDVERARTIITAHYDTCAVTPLGGGLTPGCWPVIVVIEIVQLLILPLLLVMMFFGPSNRHTANDNTSGVLLLLRLMEAMQGRGDVAFVLFDNEEKGLFGSMAFARAHPRAARRFLLNLDCVGDGETLLCTGSAAGLRCPQAKRLNEALARVAPAYGMRTVSGPFPAWLYPSDQMLFLRGTAIAALKGRRVLYLDRIHTGRDTVLEERNIRCLTEAIAAGL